MNIDYLLTEADYETLKALKEKMLTGCKACDNSGFVQLKTNKIKGWLTSSECKCMKRFKKQKEFYKARIPKIYWPITAKNFYGDKKALKVALNFIEYLDNAYESGLGLSFWGTNGNGKTSLVSIICKAAISQGYTVYYTTLQKALNLIMSSFDDKSGARELLTNVDFLAIDEIGKEHIKMNQQGSMFGMVEFEEILRQREGGGKVNIFASNLKPAQQESRYGLSISSLFKGLVKEHEVIGIDTRKSVKAPSWNNLLKGK